MADDLDVHVIVRMAGERTAAAVRALAAGQVGADNVETIEVAPFSEALRAGLERGIVAGRKWTLCLDADVLLRPDAIADLVARAEAALAVDEQLFGITGTVADKLLGQYRDAGNSLYRTALLPQALETGEFRAEKRRPETHLKRVMGRAGHRWQNLDTVIGVHDFEQSFADIFRKVFVHSRKHGRFMFYAERWWSRVAPDDADLRVALWSLQIARMIDAYAARPGTAVDENVAIDVRGFAGDLDAVLIPAGMVEKPPLDPAAVSTIDIEDWMAAFRSPPEFLSDRRFIQAEQAGGLRARLARRRHDPVIGRAIRALERLLARLP